MGRIGTADELAELACFLLSERPVAAACMRYWNKFIDEHVMNHVSMHGWHRMIGIIARNIESGEFDKLMERIPLPDQRKKWKRHERLARGARRPVNDAELDRLTTGAHRRRIARGKRLVEGFVQ